MSKHLTDEQKKKIIADYAENGNYSETSRLNNVSIMTVKRIIENEDNEEMLKKVNQKKLENTQTTLEYMQEQHQTKKEILDNLLKAINEKSKNVDMFTNVKDLATAYGIILDKELKILELNSKSNENEEEFNKARELIVKIRGLNDDE